MKFIFLKVVNDSLIDQVVEIHNQIIERQTKLQKLVKEFGAAEVYNYSRGGIAYFTFDESPDRKVWKKAAAGYLPKAKTDELHRLQVLPPEREHIEAFKHLGYGNEMIIGKREPGMSGWPMHSTQVAGEMSKRLVFLKVPYDGEKYEKEITEDFVQVKEWEMMRDLES